VTLDLLDPGLVTWPLSEYASRYGVHARVEVVEDPVEEPILLADAIDHVRAINTEEDAYIGRLIKVVRRFAEYTTRRSLMPQTLALVMDRFPLGRVGWPVLGASSAVIHVPRPPIISIESITYIDDAGSPAEQTLDPALYQTDLPRGPHAGYGRVRPIPNQFWPMTACRTLDAVRVTYRAGYLDTTSPPASPPQSVVPDDLVHGMLLMLVVNDARPTETMAERTTPATIRARSLLMPYRVY